MDSKTWQRVSDLLAGALEQPEDQRMSWLDEACLGEPELRREVEALLAIDTRTLEAGERPVFTFFDAQPDSPTSVGPYEIEREIGRGGMATVYSARDPSEDSPAPVALKLLKRGMDSDEIVRRFRREGQILGRLRHPNIAALYGGGTTEDFRPYWVMERVDGVPIDTYCAEKELDVAPRLELFLKVCEAVQHAHRNLVLHRDLKPSNILVDRRGEPKLLDFGISKWLDPETEQPVTVTVAGLRAMTPEYAAPEQIRGEPATIACDIYALGVVLFRLMTGRLPFETQTGQALLEQISNLDAPRPSSLLRSTGARSAGADLSVPDAGRFRRSLKGDLDNIIHKALSKAPERRYASVRHFAEDVENFLKDRPVAARSGGALYHLGKTLKRHRSAAVLGALLLLTLVGAAVQREIQQQEVRIERDRAVAGQDFLVNLFAEADPYQGKDGRLEVGEVLSQGVERIDGLSHQPELQGPLLSVLGEIYLNLGRFEEAQSLLERSIRVLSRPGDDGLELNKARNILGQLHAEAGNTEAAEPLLTRAVKWFSETGELEQQGGALATLALNQRNQGRLDEASKTGLEGVAVLERAGAKGTRTYLIALNNLGFVAYAKGDLQSARSYFERSLALMPDVLGPDHPDTALMFNNLASVAMGEGRMDEALELFESAHEIWARFLDPSHPNLSATQINIAALHEKQGQSAEAARRLRELLPLLQQSFGRQHSLWIQGALWLSRAEASLSNGEEAQRWSKELLAACLETHGELHPLTAEALLHQAELLSESDPNEAIEVARRARRIRAQILGPDHDDVAAIDELVALWQGHGQEQEK